ncbi:MAG: hypothetical protein KC457_23190, partial [Myxococcales bacterium]|nr:hypothetical protein [Myxococcales bacterium]
RNLETPFQAIHQGLERGLSSEDGMPIVQIRGIASYRALQRDVIVGVGQPSLDSQIDEACLALLVEPLRTLVGSWGGCQVADGSEDLYLLSGAGVPQLEYSRELGDGRDLRVLWLSARIRAAFATDSSRGELIGLNQVGIPYAAGAEIDKLLAPLLRTPAKAGQTSGGLESYERALALAIGYAETTNLHQLRALRALDEAASDLRVEAGIGSDWGRPYLLVEYSGEQLGRRALISLEHRLSRIEVFSMIELQTDPDPRARLRAAAMSRPQTIELRDVPVLAPPEVF